LGEGRKWGQVYDALGSEPDPVSAIWISPYFVSEKNEEVKLVAIVRYATTISWRKASSIKAIYRLREPLVNELAFRKSLNDMRPGIVKL